MQALALIALLAGGAQAELNVIARKMDFEALFDSPRAAVVLIAKLPPVPWMEKPHAVAFGEALAETLGASVQTSTVASARLYDEILHEFGIDRKKLPVALVFNGASRAVVQISIPLPAPNFMSMDGWPAAPVDQLSVDKPGAWAGKEAKHAPTITVNGDAALAVVRTAHSDMTEAHRIEAHWLLADGVVVGYNEPEDSAESTFSIPQDLARPCKPAFVLRAVSQCNTHGSWASEVTVAATLADGVAKDVRKLFAGLAKDADGHVLKAAVKDL
ncbi:hypothetical protein M885DRAFT_560562 [Pelagophyceae sp. CCMP2097]|nr:hypothetical protein M885DRAFT_560562 [Pelagophyceae sp. CCMP2097]